MENGLSDETIESFIKKIKIIIYNNLTKNIIENDA
jgi:hypothetical protein